MFLISADEANVINLNDKEIDMAWAVFRGVKIHSLIFVDHQESKLPPLCMND